MGEEPCGQGSCAGAIREGLPWLIKAANQGIKQAQVELGLVYQEGKFVTRDLPEAYKWFSLAAAGSQPFDTTVRLVKTYRDSAIRQMSQTQIAEGNRRMAGVHAKFG